MCVVLHAACVCIWASSGLWLLCTWYNYKLISGEIVKMINRSMRYLHKKGYVVIVKQLTYLITLHISFNSCILYFHIYAFIWTIYACVSFLIVTFIVLFEQFIHLAVIAYTHVPFPCRHACRLIWTIYERTCTPFLIVTFMLKLNVFVHTRYFSKMVTFNFR
jgi:hypothetical protein